MPEAIWKQKLKADLPILGAIAGLCSIATFLGFKPDATYWGLLPAAKGGAPVTLALAPSHGAWGWLALAIALFFYSVGTSVYERRRSKAVEDNHAKYKKESEEAALTYAKRLQTFKSRNEELEKENTDLKNQASSADEPAYQAKAEIIQHKATITNLESRLEFMTAKWMDEHGGASARDQIIVHRNERIEELTREVATLRQQPLRQELSEDSQSPELTTRAD